MNKTIFFIVILGFAGLLTACQKDNDTKVNIRLTDGPGDYQQVNIDIREIRVKTSDDTSQWLSINTNAGIYNLLNFQNGIDTLIASGTVPAVTLKEVRFILGSNNTVMVDSVVYNLQTPSAEASGLKIKIDKSLGLDLNTFVLDFDAATSIKKIGNGTYKLDPVIKLK